MNIIKDPKETEIKVKTISCLITKKERQPYSSEKDLHPTVHLKLFDQNNPHKNPEAFPHTVYEFTDVEKVRIRRLNVSFYLEGDDIVINDLEELYIQHKDNKIVLKGYQFELEERPKNGKK